MSYPFVRAYVRLGNLRVTPKAFVIHMAEGGGTVGYLSRENPNSVSVHYVIERTGRIVQMLREYEASGSINPRDIRQTDDEPFTDPTGAKVTYGVTAARAALGAYAYNPNVAVLSCEVEGYAKDGPNSLQNAALRSLIDDIRTRHPQISLLAHRDFADYKACPGKLIRWGELGRGDMEADPMIVGGGLVRTSSHVIDLPAGQVVSRSPGGPELVTLSKAATVEYFGIASPSGWYAVEVGTARPFEDGVARPVLGYVPQGAGAPRPRPPVVPDCSVQVAAALEKARTALHAKIDEVIP